MNPKTVLLVEDDPDELELTLRRLRSLPAAPSFVAAQDGAEALDYLFATGRFKDRDPSTVPAMILLDLNLPKINGLEVLRKIKSDERTRAIPVAVLTASEWDLLVSEGKRLGAEACLQKPINLDQFTDLASRFELL